MKKVFVLFLFAVCYIPLSAQKMDSAQLAVKKVYIDFAKWYRNHSEKIDHYELFRGSDTTENGMQPPWIMNWKNVEKYLANLRKKAPWLGAAFVANERKFLKSCERYWKKHPEEDLTVGFDFDRFVGGQESPQVIVDEIILSKKTKWLVEIKGNDAVIYYIHPWETDDNGKPLHIKKGTNVQLKKENGEWKISRLQNYFHG